MTKQEEKAALERLRREGRLSGENHSKMNNLQLSNCMRTITLPVSMMELVLIGTALNHFEKNPPDKEKEFRNDAKVLAKRIGPIAAKGMLDALQRTIDQGTKS